MGGCKVRQVFGHNEPRRTARRWRQVVLSHAAQKVEHLVVARKMDGEQGSAVGGRAHFVYRVGTAAEWEELQKTGATLGGDLDRRTGCIHLSQLHQVKMVLQNFFKGREDLYLLQIDTDKLGDGLVYEAVDESNTFPHFYGPSRSFCPLPLDAVAKAEKLELINGKFSSGMLN